MNRFSSKSVVIALMAIFAIFALAADKAVTKELHFDSPTVVGEKLLPAGSYKVTIAKDSLSFVQTGVPKGQGVECSVKVTSEKAPKSRTAVMNLVSNDKKQVVLASVVFGGQETKYIVSR